MNWRIINDRPRNAFFNMALDEAISEAVRKKHSPPTLRLYQWSEPSVSIGYFQRSSDIDTGYSRKKQYPVVRRSTGGTAILHDDELTYSFSARTDVTPFRGGLFKNYLIISKALVLALKMNGMEADIALNKNRRQRSLFCFKTSSYGEVTVNGEKVIGSAQKRYKHGFLQQGSLLMNFNEEELGRVLDINNHGKDFFEVGSIRKYVPGATIKNLKKSLKEAFEKKFTIKFTEEGPSGFELELAKYLESKKYSTAEWNYRK